MPSCHLSYRFVTLVSLDHVEGLRMGHNKEKVDICLFALFRTASDGQQSDMRGIGGMGPGRVATQIRQHFPRDCRDGSVDVPYQTQTNRLRIHILPRNRKSVHRELTLQRRGADVFASQIGGNNRAGHPTTYQLASAAIFNT